MCHRHCRELVLDSQLSEDEAFCLLSPVAFADWRAACRSPQRIADHPSLRGALVRFLPILLSALNEGASPDRVLTNGDVISLGQEGAARFTYQCAPPASQRQPT